MQVRELESEQINNYQEFLLGHDGALIYYSWKFKEFLKELLQCEEEYLVVGHGSEIRGVLPLMYTTVNGHRIYNSLPFFGSWGGVVSEDPVVTKTLVNAYNEIATQECVISSNLIANPLTLFESQVRNTLKYTFMDHRIAMFTDISSDHDPWASIMARIDPTARRNVKKAKRSGVVVEADDTQMHRLQEMHQDSMKRINGRAKEERFFSMVSRFFNPGQDYDLYVARKDGQVIAALLLFYFNLTVEYFVPAVDPEHRSLQPLSLILITAMSDASRRGYTRWNWGGTWLTQEGVYRFKKKWSTSEQGYNYYTQLNAPSLLTWTPDQITAAFPHFYVVPFDQLKEA